MTRKQNPNRTHLIYAGGTFGSHGTPLSPLPSDQFLPMLKQFLQTQGYAIDILPNAVIKDSSCFNPDDFVHFYRLIADAYQSGLRRFILITGTDTLSFLAAFLAMAFRGHDLSLVVTGSMSPFLNPSLVPYMPNPKSDAWHNLKTALDFCHRSHGVFVSFCHKIMAGISTQKLHSQDDNAFAGQVVHDTHINPPPSHTPKIHAHTAPIYTHYCTPNDPHHLVKALQAINLSCPTAVILMGFGAGNLPYSTELSSVIGLLVAHHFLVIMTSSCVFGERSSDYAAGAWQYQLGVLPSGSLPLPAIYAQALWLCLTLPAHERAKSWQTQLD